VVEPDATVLKVAAVMAGSRSPLVAVAERYRLLIEPSRWTRCSTGCKARERDRLGRDCGFSVAYALIATEEFTGRWPTP
jgi:hypothetical protein